MDALLGGYSYICGNIQFAIDDMIKLCDPNNYIAFTFYRKPGLCMFIRIRPSGSNDTTKVIRKGNIRVVSYRLLIRKRQRAHMRGDMVEARSLRNQVNRATAKLKFEFYHTRIEAMHESGTNNYADTTTQHEQAAAQRRSDHSPHLKEQTIHGSQCAPPASAPPHIQTATLPR